MYIAICLGGLGRSSRHTFAGHRRLIRPEHPMAKTLYEPGPPQSRWRVSYLGKRIGNVEAPDEKTAIAEAMQIFHITPARRFLIRVAEECR